MDLFSHKHLVLVVKEYFETLGDEETKIDVSLKCRISKQRITIPARGDDCDHIEVQMMQLWQNLQVVPVYILSTIYLYRAQFIACVADGICWGLVGVCERGGGRGERGGSDGGKEGGSGGEPYKSYKDSLITYSQKSWTQYGE